MADKPTTPIEDLQAKRDEACNTRARVKRDVIAGLKGGLLGKKITGHIVGMAIGAAYGIAKKDGESRRKCETAEEDLALGELKDMSGESKPTSYSRNKFRPASIRIPELPKL